MVIASEVEITMLDFVIADEVMDSMVLVQYVGELAIIHRLIVEWLVLKLQ